MEKQLSNREQEILQLIQQGYQNKEIAEKLERSQKTIEAQIRNVLMKYNVDNRMQAVMKGLKSQDIEFKRTKE
jgi:DNA-binding NarL/FixJ family response regulator